MARRRTFYTGLVIILTIITVGAIISMRIVESNTDIYDKLDTNVRCGDGEKVHLELSKEKSRGNPLLFKYWHKVIC
ncbi:hypothetical protein [Proteiniborus sp.]|uniref:hypothetical protein n=1 Tax=Proteiniborus sp. TaxID=2079015 RepID=UPI0033277944